jgi:WD40 repeat protein
VMNKVRIAGLFLTIITFIFPQLVFSQAKREFVKLNSKIGFLKGEDTIKDYKVSEDGSLIFIVGSKTIQLWDVDGGLLLGSSEYIVPKSPTDPGKLAAFLTLGLSTIPTFNIDRMVKSRPEGNYFVTFEGEKEFRKAVARQITSSEKVAVFDLPVPAQSVAFGKSNLLISGKKDKQTSLGIWDAANFRQKSLLSINHYKWHIFLKDEQKIIIGSGDTKFSWTDFTQGNKLELRDVEGGKIEKEFTAPNLNPKDYYEQIGFTSDEKRLMARREDRIFVWNVDGDGLPEYVITADDPKSSLDYIKPVEYALFNYGDDDAPDRITAPTNISATSEDEKNLKFIITKSDNKLKVFDIYGDGKPLLVVTPSLPKSKANFAGFVNDRFLIAKADEKLQIYDIYGDGKPKHEFGATKEKGKFRLIGITQDGSYFVVKNNEKLYFYEMNGNGQPISELPLFDKDIYSMQFLPGDHLIVKNKRNNKKEPHISYIYNLRTGELDYEIPFQFFNPTLSRNKEILYEERTGEYFAWYLPTKQFFSVGLETKTKTCDADDKNCTPRTYNIEHVELSPNERFFIKYGFSDGNIFIYDAEKTDVAQKIFSAARFSMVPELKIKNVGFDTVKFSKDGKYLFTSERGSESISIWDLID